MAGVGRILGFERKERSSLDIWYHTRWAASHDVAMLDWTGVMEEEKNEARTWSEDRKKQAHKEGKGQAEPEDKSNSEAYLKGMENTLHEHLEKKRKECRGGCGA